MNSSPNAFVRGDPAAILDRHSSRRTAGVPTISLLVGPIGAGTGAWRRWASAAGRSVVVARRDLFPRFEWVHFVAEQVDLPAAAIQYLARRAGRDPGELLAAWQAKTIADRERFWNTLEPMADDDLLREVANLAVRRGTPDEVASSLSDLGEPIIPVLARLDTSAHWPVVLFVADSGDEFLAVGRVAVKWATRVPALAIAVAVPAGVWDHYIATAAESRMKTFLKEGELTLPFIDASTVEQALTEAGMVASTARTVAGAGAAAALLESAVAAVSTGAAPPTTQADDDLARSEAERFLFMFLESLPETAGRFELNATLDFPFGPRPAEVDLLCRSPRIAIELDGYFHFLAPDGYRRDRAKDWELQRRGFVVLRFLAEDVIPQLEMIRDRILDALNVTPIGAYT
jgi:Protein of unknown function (DUF559)